MEEFNPEKNKGVNLRIIPAVGDKHIMVGFDAHNDEEAEAYNEACAHYLKNLRSFHQAGHEGGAGYSAWEIWQDIDTVTLEDLMHKIETDAQILLSKTGVEELYERWSSHKDRPGEIDYKKLLAFKRIDTNGALRNTWSFAVSENYTIFLTPSGHEHIFESCGVDSEKTLTEGYVKFDEEGMIQNISFKAARYQSTPGFKGYPDDLLKLQAAIREIIREKLAKK